MSQRSVTYVQKACAYITRASGELLVFEGPEFDGLQIPKGTIEDGENPREAVFREIVEESGLSAVGETRHLTSDIWTRRESPPRRYVRHFFHTTVHEPRDQWTHTVTGDGEETGSEFEFSWIDEPATCDQEFALALDDYVHLIDTVPTSAEGSSVSHS